MLTLPLDLSHGPLLFGDKTGDESWIIGQKGNPCVKRVGESVGKRRTKTVLVKLHLLYNAAQVLLGGEQGNLQQLERMPRTSCMQMPSRQEVDSEGLYKTRQEPIRRKLEYSLRNPSRILLSDW